MELNKYAFALTALLGLQQAQGQWITLTDLHGNDVTNGMANEWELTGGTTQVIHLDAVISGPVGRTVNVKRYETGVQAGTQNYFCWALCYLPRNAGQTPLWVSGDDQAMSPGNVFSGFGGYHIPSTTYGSSSYRFVFYDVNNPTDSAFVDLAFTGVLSVADRAAAGAFTIVPNPANTDVTVMVADGADQVQVFNALGERVLQRGVGAADRTINMVVADLQQGVYFVTLLERGRAIATQRLVVAH